MATCAYCKGPSEMQASIHRDGFIMGPEVWLCNDCAGYDGPGLEQIWGRIRLLLSYGFLPDLVDSKEAVPKGRKIEHA